MSKRKFAKKEKQEQKKKGLFSYLRILLLILKLLEMVDISQKK